MNKKERQEIIKSKENKDGSKILVEVRENGVLWSRRDHGER